MRLGRSVVFAVLGIVVLAMAGCHDGAPPTGSRTIVPSDHLHQQQARLEQIKARLKVSPTAKIARRRSIGAGEAR